MRTTLSLLFSLRKRKNYLTREMPIDLHLTVDGKRTVFAVSRKCDPERWDAATGGATGPKADSRTLNAYLDGIQFKIFEIGRRTSEAKDFKSNPIFLFSTAKNIKPNVDIEDA